MRSLGVGLRSLTIDLDVDLSVHALLKRDKRFGLRYALNMLDTVVEQLHEMLVVLSVNLDEHGVGTSGEVTFHHFGNLVEFLNHFAIHRTFQIGRAHV